ncbi:glycosyltransferase [Kaistella daneshvariae]|jgi:GT2 family glycosyltransferase|uniref:Glycosyltransferase n=1 Tax=Kaistella daneshvariae TaxID=2487074 RepID=A0A3N0X045_9FLAO|nr:glycosyltransferase family 2 protein [Kaistella daneshvariae]AZI67843.1 glycosyltransferase [Kaistella daneshvariae]ROI10727.1 glycosyltransferase family 2 protein [Kaistella daneshvariae]
MKLSVLIVNYNVTDLLRNCLLSLQKYITDVDYEVIVIDNCSTDSTWKNLIQEFPDFQFLTSCQNEGFAKANNKAAKIARGEYILLLNPDTELEDFSGKTLLDFADSKQNFGALGVRMHDAGGNFLPESKRSVPDVFSSFRKLYLNFNKHKTKSYYRNDIGEFDIAEVEVVTGAFLLVKRAVFFEIGGLEEKYFMYGEDIDFCYTLLRSDYSNWYYGKTSILHHKGQSTVKDLDYLRRFYGAMQVFVDKYYKDQKPIQHRILSAGLKMRHSLEKQRIK